MPSQESPNATPGDSRDPFENIPTAGQLFRQLEVGTLSPSEAIQAALRAVPEISGMSDEEVSKAGFQEIAVNYPGLGVRMKEVEELEAGMETPNGSFDFASSTAGEVANMIEAGTFPKDSLASALERLNPDANELAVRKFIDGYPDTAKELETLL